MTQKRDLIVGPGHMAVTLASLIGVNLLGLVLTACPSTYHATDQICEPGQLFCEGGALLTCSDDGSKIDQRQICASGICENNACLSADAGNADASVIDSGALCGQTTCTGLTYCDQESGSCLPGCGADSQCGAHERCDLQTHSCVCQADYHLCGISCVSDNDPIHCGTSCTPCPDIDDGYATCDQGTCGLACDANFHFCDDVCVSSDAVETCGDRCEVCADDAHGLASCLDQSCAAECYSGYHWCDFGCALDHDVASCGLRCDPCPDDPNGEATCVDAQCALTCDDGFVSCGGVCAACPAIDNSVGACEATSCVFAGCTAGYRVCGQACCEMTLTTIASASRMGRSAVAVDSNGLPHFIWNAYAGNGLYYQAGEEGSPEEIEAGSGDGEYLALAIDGADQPLVAYYHQTDKQLKFATRSNAGWTSEVIDADGDVGTYLSMALDSNGQAHVSYYDADRKDLKYAVHSDEGWEVQFVDLGSDVGTDSALTLDRDNRPHIAYWAKDSRILRYARWTGSTWLFADVDTGLHIFPGTDLILDSNGQPQIFYTKPGVLRRAYLTNNTWQFEDVFGGNILNSATAEFDANDRIHLLFVNDVESVGTNDLHYLLYADGHWLRSIVEENLGFLGGMQWLSLTSSGVPNISYKDYTGQVSELIRYAH